MSIGEVIMEEFDVLDFFGYIKKYRVFLCLVVIFTLVISLFYFLVVRRPVYTSDVSMTLTGITGSGSKITTNDITLNTKMIPTYQEIITSRNILDQVNNNLKVDVDKSMIKISAATDSMILKIQVTNSNRVLARDIANEIAGIFGEEIKSLYNIQNVTILDKAVINDNPSNINYLKSIVISLGAGIFISFGSLLLIYLLDNTVKSAEQIDSKLQMIVLGSVPNYNNTDKKKKRGGKKNEN